MAKSTEYAQKRKNKKIAAFVCGGSSLIIVIFVVIAFLGNNVGRYTVSLERNRASLTMSVDNSFNKKTTLLRATDLEAARAESVDYLPDHETLDNELGQGSHNGYVLDEDGNVLYSTYFAYTFYMMNLGDSPVDYQVTLSLVQKTNIIEGSMPIEEYVRVRLYENLDTKDGVAHSYRTFAKTTNLTIYDGDSNRVNGECIGNYQKTSPFSCDASRSENSVRAEEFSSSSKIVDYNYIGFQASQIMRYTIVIWLEGDDPDCAYLPPEGASMEFGMNISALINDESSSSL